MQTEKSPSKLKRKVSAFFQRIAISKFYMRVVSALSKSFLSCVFVERYRRIKTKPLEKEQSDGRFIASETERATISGKYIMYIVISVV